MRKNPFLKYLGKEDHLQHAVITYLTAQYPDCLYCHVPNEGRRTPFERFKLKYLGVSSGVPDLLIFDACNGFNGLAIELKYGANKMTLNQKKWIAKLNKKGWRAVCLNNFESIKDEIDKYLRYV